MYWYNYSCCKFRAGCTVESETASFTLKTGRDRGCKQGYSRGYTRVYAVYPPSKIVLERIPTENITYTQVYASLFINLFD